MEIATEKLRLRRAVASRRRNVPPARVRRVAAAIAQHVGSAPEFQRAARVALYAALADEVATAPLFELCCAHGKRVLMPRVAEPRLEFAPVASLGELRPGRYGVEEPPVERPAVAVAAEDLVLVPGVAFDRNGNRLGRGGGHYDRTFPPGQPGPLLFGVAYALQVVSAVPHAPSDRRVDAIVTENGIHRVGRIERGHER